ncbi:MAG: hypothetical protein HND27_08325 [Bacteroidetes bacterium]|nr:hypothetical protein [Bacteroidota bacterium]MCL4815783.1 hypothetical protein [Flavobacteriales bacterium]NOG95771.1 hypothetical protein [Bacteroidota bacterium]GIK68770.1 MAG: hypothetical protein BroJett020_00650 [Bacteroidota bacterium]CAG0980329.1 hypothetical protein FLAV_01731 [Flavobacteriales bacterium]
MSIFSLSAISQNLPNTLPDTGFVGVGTTNPTCNFQVIGQSQISGNLTVDSSLTISDSAHVNNNLRVSGNLYLQGNAYFNSLADTALPQNQFKLVGVNKNGELAYSNVIVNQDDTYLCSPVITPWVYANTISQNPVNPNDVILCPNYGFLGVGLSKPLAPFHVSGKSILFNGLSVGTTSLAQNYSSPNQLKLDVNGDARFYRINNSDYISLTHDGANSIIEANGTGALLLNYYSEKEVVIGNSNTQQKSNFSVFGNVGIGTAPNPNIALSVCGSIKTTKVEVRAPWCDYVFKPEYKLRSLTEVEQHIQAYGHLPEIPNEKEVDANGIEVGEMISKLLLKIEELTLYTIEQEKRIKELESKVK